MKNAVVGFRVHSGWAAIVVIALGGSVPVVVCRRRAKLVRTYTYAFRQPYHTAESMRLAEGRAFVAAVGAEATRLAKENLREIEKEARDLGYCIKAGALLMASGRELPQLKRILASHALIHTADGELFRAALGRAGRRCGIRIERVHEKQLLEQASGALGIEEAALLRKVTEMGRAVGRPWTQDEKFAAIAAWLALSG